MMKQVFEESEQQKPSAQASVTPKEFAEAVAAIENRRATQAQTSESVSVGDAIQQLGLTVSAEEVLAVIEHRRAEEMRRIQQSASWRRRVVSVIGRTVFALSLFLNIYLLSPLHGTTPPVGMDATFVETGTLRSIAGQSGT